MTNNRFSAALLLAIVLLLLPALYVASYFTLVDPQRIFLANAGYYRWEGERLAAFYWPIEQIDRRLRPGTWEDAVLIELITSTIEISGWEHEIAER